MTQPGHEIAAGIAVLNSLVIPFAPAPDAVERPARFPTPFDRKAVHPLARRAANELMADLMGQQTRAWRLQEPGNGKMFGVLVVDSADGTLGYLRGFSGMIDGQWRIDGWAPPTFDDAARAVVWGPGEAEMLDFTARRAALLASLPADHASPDAVRVQAHVRALDVERTARSRVTNSSTRTKPPAS